MTVNELIGLLQEYPAGLRVVVNGYEEGYDDLSPQQLSVTKIHLDTGKHEWEGRHGDPPYPAEEIPSGAEKSSRRWFSSAHPIKGYMGER